MVKILGALVTLAVGIGLAIVAWPQLFGLQNTWIIAHAVAVRGVTIVGALVLLVLLLLATLSKRLRRFAASLAVLLIAFSVVVSAIMVTRGIGDTHFAERSEDSVTVFSWNTLGDEPGAEKIAELAVEAHADIITLPETTKQTGIDVAIAMREAGNPMWVRTVAFDEISKARSTTILISPRLGGYHQVSSNANRADNTKVLPSVVLEPLEGDGPRIVAVHAVSPQESQMTNWRDDLAWLAAQCTSGSVIMAGDFNATIDHMAGLGTDGGTLGLCRDAGAASGKSVS